MKYKGIIFDFNGVLWLDNHIQEIAWKDFSKTQREDELTNEEIEIHVLGRNIKYTLEYLKSDGISDREIHRLTQEKEEIYRELCIAEGENFKLSPGAIELFGYLEFKKIRYTIATASGRENLDFFNKHLNLERWFEIDKIIYDDGTHRGKPHPEIYQKAASIIEQEPKGCVVIEDSISGIKSAINAGIGYLIGLGPKINHKKLNQTGVNIVIEKLEQVPMEKLF